MPEDRNRNSVLRQLAALQQMSFHDLQEKWRDLYGSEPPNYSKKFMIRQLAYRIQELFYGGLENETQRKLLGRPQSPAEVKRKFASAVGTRFLRVWGNQEHEVTVVDGGFVYRGQKFRSLSAVAKKITGTHWNGRKFFGLPRSNRKTRSDKKKK
jgi:hypothetical protein